uniref:Ribosomal protein/NADH dehydrogenase domain-containing protein n=1 Tax=Chromera velia CCMP2878 TaxID=1169474 RepID=A0A0G4I340_9ALVE|mmetsp:Transcript_24095/g.47296  ORF Transcript_24095/g.47296 Transcript_24095/m.47296 type:complete len:122 (-) Transcript_24095:158-523(-)|eukprot:Cvel_1741.t1-p1 / transcript=Cvel_1741.t1 / gene=Cvel_1741 / organism=Chromera_velia_CCMP2878 / gene_product=hypothetical protein / transcript_product=hypothetical protein / location=Cvel_scaffold63:92843-95618(-) / protein_length=121 / sequence_SO=supercontig / SO=protein_coding / is_pseudo=false
MAAPPRVNLFVKPNFFSYIKKIHVAYRPGKPNTDVCRQIIFQMHSQKIRKLFPKLEASYDLLGYDGPSSVDIELVTGKMKRFIPEQHSLQEMMTFLAQDRSEAHLDLMRREPLDKKEGEDD